MFGAFSHNPHLGLRVNSFSEKCHLMPSKLGLRNPYSKLLMRVRTVRIMVFKRNLDVGAIYNF